MGLFAELKRRKVIKVGGAYLVVAWLIVQVASIGFPAFEAPPWALRVFIFVTLLGFPIALVLAWAFEMTPEGMKLTANVPEGESIAPTTGGKLDYVILVGIGLIAVIFIADRLMPERAAPASVASIGPTGEVAPQAASIAVLPFADLSPGGDQAYFSDGVAEEILNVLARVDGLKVASRTSSFQFRSMAAGVPEIAKELGVRHILEGSVRKAGDAIRVTAQLIDAEADAHLWSETFDRPLTTETVFAIQDEIANAIVAALREKIGVKVGEAAAALAPTSDVDAYELYLQGRALFQSRRNLGEADHLLEEAIRRDPRFADALAIRAAIHQFGGEYGALTGDDQEARRIGRAFAEQALAINAESSLALAVTALSHFYDHLEGHGSQSYESIFAAFDRSLEIDRNNSNALNWQGIAYSFVGDNERAAAVHRHCMSVDPTLAACRSNLAFELISLGRKGEAEAIVDAAVDAGAWAVGPGQLIILAELKRREGFLFLAVNVPALRGWRKFNALYEAMSDSASDDRALATELKALLDKNKASARVYTLLNGLGDYERPPLVVVHWLGVMTPYRRSPEFKKHARASKLPDYWRKHGFPLQCKPVGKDDFECE
jgi:TolB-like protein